MTGELANNIFSWQRSRLSALSGAPLRGSADVAYEQAPFPSRGRYPLGRNSIKTNGKFSARRATASISTSIARPRALRLRLERPDRGQRLCGRRAEQNRSQFERQARNVRIQKAVAINQLDFKLQGSPDYSRPLDIELKGNRIVIPGSSEPTVVDAVNLFAKGTGRSHRINGGGSMALGGKPYKLEIDANGGLNEQNQWKGALSVLDISGAFNLKLQNRMNLEAGAERVVMSAARWSAMGGSLNWSNLFGMRNGITTKGSAQNLAASELHNSHTLPVQHNLVLSGDWDLS